MEEVCQVTTVTYQTKIIGAVIVLLFFSGCIKNVDVLSPFHIYGKVVEKNGENAVEEVEVFFIDTGFDYVRSKDTKKGTYKIGISAKDGYFDLTFKYFWGYKEAFYKAKPNETFDLIFKKKGYEEKIISYDSKKLHRKDTITEVEVGEVSLIPIKR